MNQQEGEDRGRCGGGCFILNIMMRKGFPEPVACDQNPWGGEGVNRKGEEHSGSMDGTGKGPGVDWPWWV